MKYLDSPAQSKPSQQQHTRTIPAIRLSSVTIGLLINICKIQKELRAVERKLCKSRDLIQFNFIYIAP